LLVWLPPSYHARPQARYPVAYFLHGAFGSETDWTRQGRLAETLDSLVVAGMPEIIVVMPDGDDGWYTTWNWLGDYGACQRNRPAGGEPAATYCVPWPHYDDYIARDLVSHVDRTFRTLAERHHRGVAGLSMGGYGAITLALSYPDVFGAAASHSGVLAPAAHQRGSRAAFGPFMPDSLEAAYGARLWPQLTAVFGNDSAGWFAHDPLRRADRLFRQRPLLMPALYADCGTEDFLIGQNRLFRDGLRSLGIALAYAEYPGAHSWAYWRRHASRSAWWLARQLSVR
jgi:S-formylglutathione hydrolase FrmB